MLNKVGQENVDEGRLFYFVTDSFTQRKERNNPHLESINAELKGNEKYNTLD